jgi:hypothetical protein
MFSHLLAEPLWLQAWVAWMILINTLSLAFLRRIEARWVLAAWLCNLVSMSVLYEMNGYNRLLGLSHVIWWTPLLVYLFRRRPNLSEDQPFRTWIVVLFLTNAVSLLIDYTDVIRYLLGDRT